MIQFYKILFFILLVTSKIFSQDIGSPVRAPKHEVRAVWLATVMGLDWPRTFDRAAQQQSLREIVRSLKSANFNTIFFQVRGRADAMYRSRYEPWSQQLTGTLGDDPGWDPLEFIITEAHAQGMEVHVWFNTFLVKSGGPRPTRSIPMHVILTHPEWMQQVNGELWFDPGLPEVREYNMNVAMDIVRKYAIDGFQFDFIRYPGKSFPDESTYRVYGNGLPKDEWRRENINQFLRAFHDSVSVMKPMLKIGATPIGIYKNFNDVRGQQSYSELYQDSRRWLKEKILDYIVPQVYWSLGTGHWNPDFASVVREWSGNTYDRQVYIGVGAYKPEVLKQIPVLIDSTRSIGLMGNSFFRYENIKSSLDVGARYETPAMVPSMLWKDNIPPCAPFGVQVSNITDGIFSIRWDNPLVAIDGDTAKSFAIYRSRIHPIDITDPSNLLKIVPGETHQLLDTIGHITSANYSYAVTSIDKGNNESAPAVESVVIPEIVQLAKAYANGFSLGMNYPNPASSVIFVPYELNERAPVFLKILDKKSQEVLSIVDTVQEPGRYVASANIEKLKDGTYTYLLIAGNATQKRTFEIDH